MPHPSNAESSAATPTRQSAELPQESWIQAFVQVFERCRIANTESVVVLTESGSRPINVLLAELALSRLGVTYYRMVLPSGKPVTGPIVRSSGASLALTGRPGDGPPGADAHC